MFKESRTHVTADTEIETDSGYTGITAIHLNSLLPKKHKKNKPLTKEEKKITVLFPEKEFMQNMSSDLSNVFASYQNDTETGEKDFLSGFLCLLVFVTLICSFNFARGLIKKC